MTYHSMLRAQQEIVDIMPDSKTGMEMAEAFEEAEWSSIQNAPEGELVETKIDDHLGIRNESNLRRSGNRWVSEDGRVYVYYTPTHWRPIQEPGK